MNSDLEYNVISDAIDNSSFIGGRLVEQFYKDLHRAAHCVACASGTDALKLALMAAGVGCGDEVVTVPNTFIATVEAITLAGAAPAFVDIYLFDLLHESRSRWVP